MWKPDHRIAADRRGLRYPMGMAVAALASGCDVPSRRFCARQRMALDALTPNRSAAARRDNPSIAETTRPRRSIDHATAMHARLLRRLEA